MVRGGWGTLAHAAGWRPPLGPELGRLVSSVQKRAHLIGKGGGNHRGAARRRGAARGAQAAVGQHPVAVARLGPAWGVGSTAGGWEVSDSSQRWEWGRHIAPAAQPCKLGARLLAPDASSRCRSCRVGIQGSCGPWLPGASPSHPAAAAPWSSPAGSGRHPRPRQRGRGWQAGLRRQLASHQLPARPSAHLWPRRRCRRPPGQSPTQPGCSGAQKTAQWGCGRPPRRRGWARRRAWPGPRRCRQSRRRRRPPPPRPPSPAAAPRPLGPGSWRCCPARCPAPARPAGRRQPGGSAACRLPAQRSAPGQYPAGAPRHRGCRPPGWRWPAPQRASGRRGRR